MAVQIHLVIILAVNSWLRGAEMSQIYTITSAVAYPMLSNHCGYDSAGFGSWTNINGVNAEITCVINVNSQAGGFCAA